MKNNSMWSSARDFEFLVEKALYSIYDPITIKRSSSMVDTGADLTIYFRDGTEAVVEVKLVSPATSYRFTVAAKQLQHVGALHAENNNKKFPKLILVLSGTLSNASREETKRLGIDEIIDGPTLRSKAPALPWPDFVARDVHSVHIDSPNKQAQDHPLSGELTQIPSGRDKWSLYQRAVRDILSLTLSHSLSKPLDEHSTDNKVNRRDIIFPNYADKGIWKFLRDHYDAHFVVVDAKNSTTGVKKSDILQMSNYLSVHGAGLFGIIACRDAVKSAAEITRQEQWIIHRKLIIFLHDSDLNEMLFLHENGEDPSVLIRQKIEDFRLSI